MLPPIEGRVLRVLTTLGLRCRSGDHTVKIICCRTGQCLKVLSGHRRTPWVVRFHPTRPQLLASGSLDYEARGLPFPSHTLDEVMGMQGTCRMLHPSLRQRQT